MTKEELAAVLNGREYGNEMTKVDIVDAFDSGLVVVFGYSDDNCEFEGFICDEVGCWKGGEIGIFWYNDNWFVNRCEKNYIDDMEDPGAENAIKEAVKNGNVITAVRCNGEFAWSYKTTIPHATFNIMESGVPLCQGLVFNINDISK